MALPVFTDNQIINQIETSWSGSLTPGAHRKWPTNQITYELGIQSGSFTAGASNEGSGYVPMAADQITFARQAFALWAEIANITFTEQTFAELKARMMKTADFVMSVPAAKIDGSADKDISMKIGGKDTVIKGGQYLLGHAYPNFYFHSTTAYNILRHNGIEVGKRDFLGTIVL